MKNTLQAKNICIGAEIARLQDYGLLEDVLYLLNNDEQRIIKAIYGLDGLVRISLEHFAQSTGMMHSEAEQLRSKAFANFLKTAAYVWESTDY